MMKRIIIFTFVLLISLSLSAQDNTVRLTVSGEGATKEEATANALRSAIEQAFGTFVSANTQILNDDIVKDEIATISSGNIQEYTELGCITMPDGSKSVSLSATVSIGNLISYAKSKGSSAEFAGAVFAMNMKMRKLNAENETKALLNMLDQLYELAPSVFDWRLEARDPIVASAQQYKIPFTVKSIVNEASQAFYSILINTFQSLSLSPIEVDEYNINGMTVYPVEIEGKKYFLRNSPSEILALIQYLIYCINKSYNIKACLNGADDTSVNLEYINNEDLRYRDDRILLFRNGKTDESYTVMSEELLNTLQGFDITHTPITQFEFENQNNTIIATRLTVYQPLDIPGQIDVKGLKYLKIKDGLKKIKMSQFSHSNSLTDVHIGDCVKHIEAYSFSSCKSLRKVVIGNGVTSIGENAFNGCKNLDTVILGDSVTFISDHAFAFCNILKITFPRNIDSIGESAFYGNKNLQEIYLNSIVPPSFGIYPFGELHTHNTTFKIFVPKQSVERYKNLYHWESYSPHIVGYEALASCKETQANIDAIKPFLKSTYNTSKIVFKIKQICIYDNYTQKWSDWEMMNSTIELDCALSTFIFNPIDFNDETDKSLLITDLSEWKVDDDGDRNLNIVCYKGDIKFNVRLSILDNGYRRIYLLPVGSKYNSFCFSITE